MNVETDRTVVLVSYVLHLVGATVALPSIVGLVLNYMRRNEAGAVLSSHHGWMIRSFWWALLWIVVGALTIILLVGWLILALAWLWYVYRHVRGMLNLFSGEPMPE